MNDNGLHIVEHTSIHNTLANFAYHYVGCQDSLKYMYVSEHKIVKISPLLMQHSRTFNTTVVSQINI